MSNTDSLKRKLAFQNFDELADEIRRLLEEGYTPRGKWNLAQACGHISEWMRFPMDGFPPTPLALRPLFWLMRLTVAKRMARRILEEGFRGGLPTAPDTVPAPDARSDAEAVAELEKTIQRVQRHQGPLHPSPLFGPMDDATWKKVNLLHAAHHLAYLWPRGRASEPQVS